MPSFDIAIKMDLQEVDNAVNQAQKEIGTRYDFRGSDAKIDWDKDKLITLSAEDEYKLKALLDVLQSKMVKRGISIKNIKEGEIESATGSTVRQKLTLQMGIPDDKAKQITKLIKGLKIKVQPQIQGEEVRVTGKKRDDLQEVMGHIKQEDLGLDFQFVNFRD